MEEEKTKVAKNFRDLGVFEELVDACQSRGWVTPTKIQAEAIPQALQGIVFSNICISMRQIYKNVSS